MHATGLSLEQLGVSQLPANTRLSFKHLNSQLSPSGTPPLFAFRTTPLSITEMIAAPTGVFVAIAYHGYDEDVEAVDSNFVRDRFAQGIELPKHFVTFNLDTNVVVTYPEVCQHHRNSFDSCKTFACHTTGGFHQSQGEAGAVAFA